MPFLIKPKLPFISIENNYIYSFLLYFFIACYIICISFLIYTLIRLLQTYLRRKQMNRLFNNVINYPSQIGTVVLKIHNIDEIDMISIRNELECCQPLVIKTQDLPPNYTESYQNQPPPPDYKEYL